MNLKQTVREFELIEFTDSNGEKCSLQKSSSVEDKIWLGISSPKVKEFYPYPRETDESWFELSEKDLDKLKHRPQNTLHICGRMHLSREQVKELLPFLQNFVQTGNL